MSTRRQLRGVIRDGIPFVAIMAVWIAITAVVYGAFVLVWPDVPAAEPWIHLGVYLFPVIGYLGHTIGEATRDDRA